MEDEWMGNTKDKTRITIIITIKSKTKQHRIMTQIITTTTNDALVAAHIAAITAKTGSVLMGTSKALLIEEAKRQARTTAGAHVIYKKVNGEIREAFMSLNSALCGKHIKGTGSSPENRGCTCYWDMEKGGFRSFRWENLIAVLS